MTVRNETMTVMRRVGAGVGTLALMVAGAVVTAGPAAAAESGDCPPAASPPSPNTWYDARSGDYRGVRKISDERGPKGRYAMWAIQEYETFGHGYYQRETWDVDWLRGPTRTECERQERPKEEPRPPSGGGGRGGGGTGGGGGWVIIGTPGGGEQDRYGIVGDIEAL